MSAPTVADLQVRGGAGGTSAQLETLDALAAALAARAQALGGAAAVVAGAATSPDLLGTALLAPRGAGEAAAALGRCGAGLLALAAEVDALATAVRATVGAYRSWEGATSAAVDGVRQGLGGLLLWGAVPSALAVGSLVAVGAGDLAVLSWAAGRVAQARATAGGVGPEEAAAAGRSGQAVTWTTGTTLATGEAGDVASRAWEALGPGQDDVAEAGVDAVVGATAPVAVVVGLAAPVVPGTVPAGAAGAPLLARAWASGYDQGSAAQAHLVVPPTTGVAPARTPGDLVRRAGDLKIDQGAAPGSVRVDRTPGVGGAPGRVVVYLPATQNGVRPGGTNPADMETNLRAVGGERTAVATGTVAAMRAAGVRGDDEVAFVGFSQGGLTAAELAGDPEVRSLCDPRVVLTAGSPTATIEAPPGVTLLSLEHDGDPMAALDGAPNPDLPSWTTVRAPTDGVPHDAGSYGRTGDLVAASTDPSLVAFSAALAPFLAAGPTTTSSTYQLLREPPPAPPRRASATAPRPAAAPGPTAGRAAVVTR